jgi:small subunit ribosomal protein S8
MSVDLMSNMLSSIKNAAMVKKPSLEIMYSKQCEAVAKVLAAEGYISGVKVFKESGKPFKKLRLDLAYDDAGFSVIQNLIRVSKPGRRMYKGSSELGRYMSGFGVQVVSTSRGVMTGTEARNKKLGGEVICKVH